MFCLLCIPVLSINGATLLWDSHRYISTFGYANVHSLFVASNVGIHLLRVKGVFSPLNTKHFDLGLPNVCQKTKK